MARSCRLTPGLQHAFSIIEAELCSPCGEAASLAGDNGGPGSVPAALCLGTICAGTGGFPLGGPGQGSFEWDCESGCSAEGYCEVDLTGITKGCPGWPGYVTIDGSGQCVAVGTDLTPPATSCVESSACGFQQSCVRDGGGEGVCQANCSAFQPANCVRGCQLQSDNHGCNICFCPDAGCPSPPDAG